jgi:hypothetical protein
MRHFDNQSFARSDFAPSKPAMMQPGQSSQEINGVTESGERYA